MIFSEVFKLMKVGAKAKLPSWGGYWTWCTEKETILMHTKDGSVLDLRETQVVEYTLDNILNDNWILAEEFNTPILGGENLFGFEETLKYLKRGMTMTRKGWNGKGMNVTMIDGKDIQTCLMNPFFVIKNPKGSYNTWVPSISDVLAEDWMFSK